MRKAAGAFVQAIVRAKKWLDSHLGDHVARACSRLFGGYVPWLAAELVLAFLGDLASRAYGKPVGRRSRIESLAPSPKLVLDRPHNLTDAEWKSFRKQALRLYDNALRRHIAALQGRVPKAKAGSVERNAV